MKQSEFEYGLRDTADHVFSYGLKKLRQSEESLKEVLNQIGPQVMRREDFKGFVYAQEQILKSILFIEDELIAIRNEKKKIEKGKHKKELQQNPDYIKANKKEQYLIIQEAAFREIANSIVWILFGGVRGHLRRLVNPNLAHGYLRDRNWKSVLRVVGEMNKKKDTFALLSDITSTIGIGDILAWTSEGIKIIEVKEGRVNQQAQEIAQSKLFVELNNKLNRGGGEELHKHSIKYSRSFTSQIARQKRQLERDEPI